MPCETITLTAYNNAGTVITAINVEGNLVYGTDYHDVPYNQSVVETLDGGQVSHGNSTYKKVLRLILKSLTQADGLAFKTFLRSSLSYRAYYIGIGLNGASVNLGKGLGVDIVYADRAKILNTSGHGLAELKAPGNYDINLDIRYT